MTAVVIPPLPLTAYEKRTEHIRGLLLTAHAALTAAAELVVQQNTVDPLRANFEGRLDALTGTAMEVTWKACCWAEQIARKA